MEPNCALKGRGIWCERIITYSTAPPGRNIFGSRYRGCYPRLISRSPPGLATRSRHVAENHFSTRRKGHSTVGTMNHRQRQVFGLDQTIMRILCAFMLALLVGCRSPETEHRGVQVSDLEQGAN